MLQVDIKFKPSFLPFSFVLLVSGLLLVFPSCTTDFPTEAEWRDIPIVYGFLSTQDTAHYIRVEKAFLESGGNALDIAQIADSLYYDPSVTVSLEKINTGERFLMDRVDGTLEGYPREEGPFATTPNILYKILKTDLNLKSEDAIRLVIERGDDKAPVTAETLIIGELELLENLPREPINFGGYNSELRIGWEVSTAARLFDLRFLVHYRESDPDQPSNLVPKTLEFVLNRAIEREDESIRVSYFLRSGDFFQFLGGALPVLSAGFRVFDGIDIQLVAAGEEFLELTKIGQANLGITSANEVPIYTNLSEGRGIFSSKATALREGLLLGPVSIDTLQNGAFTRDLGFQ
ncbi:MAG: hypothetical protein KTR30_18275 [Saprospiraceae bacterium]|nr:hypothetical protein [Saprospiraceae bacterium]